jgi:hypothetical protein
MKNGCKNPDRFNLNPLETASSIRAGGQAMIMPEERA